jgi:hypothetical protein
VGYKMKPDEDLQKLQGTWRQVALEANGIQNPEEDYGPAPSDDAKLYQVRAVEQAIEEVQ